MIFESEISAIRLGGVGIDIRRRGVQDRGDWGRNKGGAAISLILGNRREVIASHGCAGAAGHDLVIDFDGIQIDRGADVSNRLKYQAERKGLGSLRLERRIRTLQSGYVYAALPNEVPG